MDETMALPSVQGFDRKVSPYLGLDFGTSTTLLAKSRGVSATEVLTLGRATAWMPSVLGYDDVSERPLIGEDAEVLPAARVKRSIKSAITERESDVEFQLRSGVLRRPADEVATQIIAEALRRADWNSLRGHVAGVRAGCPAMWDGEQRARLRRIMANAGLHVDPADLIDEPIAAAVAWVNHRRQAFEERVQGRLVVFDYGGGTLDIAVCEVDWYHDLPEITVLSCDGFAEAGDALDHRLTRYVNHQLLWEDPRFTGEGEQLAAISREVRWAKEKLSRSDSVALELAHYGFGPLALSRAELEREFRPQLNKALARVTFSLRAARLREKDHLSPTDLRRLDADVLDPTVNFVLLAGGMSRIPLVREELQRRFFQARVESVSDATSGGIEGPQHLVAAGLICDPGTYDRLNLHRPGFNLRVEWRTPGGQWEGHDVYVAHTPLYAWWEIASGNFLPGSVGEVVVPADHEIAEARLIVTSESGEKLPLRLDRSHIEGLSLRVRGGQKVSVKLYVDGRILVNVNDHEHKFEGSAVRIERWQVIRGPGSRHRRVELVSERFADRSMFAHPHK